MAVVTNWLSLQQRLDRIVDSRFEEPVELHPWTGGGYSSDGGPDASRAVLKTSAIFVTPGASVTGESGSAHGSDMQIVEDEAWISIQDDLLGDPTAWKPYDRIYLPFRAAWFALAYVGPSATRRSNIHMVRLQANIGGTPTLSMRGQQQLTQIQARKSPDGRTPPRRR